MNDLWFKLGAAGVFLTIPPFLLYEGIMQPVRWERYKVAHHCFIKVPPVPHDHAGGWECDDRKIYFVPRVEWPVFMEWRGIQP